jgi:hypothetical protein
LAALKKITAVVENCEFHVSAIMISYQSTLIVSVAQNIGIGFLRVTTHILEFGQKSELVPWESRQRYVTLLLST